MFIQCLLLAKDCCRHWEYISEKKRKKNKKQKKEPCLHKAYILAGV